MKKRKIIDIYPPSAKIPERKVNNEISSAEKKEPSSDEGVPIEVKKTHFGEANQESYREEQYFASQQETREEKKTVEPIPVIRRNQKFNKSTILKIAGVLLGGILLYYLGFVAFTKADVAVTPQRQNLDFSGTVLADRNSTQIQYSQAVIPAHMFVFQESVKQTFTSTGKGRDEKKAQGTITIYNDYSQYPQILVATTRFETPDHKIYRIDSRLVIPGASRENGKIIPSSIEAKVTADKAGADYNIPPCQLPKCKFTIPGFAGTKKFQKFYAVSNKAMTGGSSSAIPLITSQDSKAAENAILDKLMHKLTQDSKDKIPAGLVILDSAQSGINVTQLKSDASVGDERQTFTVTGQGNKKVIAFQKIDLVKYIQNQLKDKKDANYDFCNDPDVKYQELKPNFTKGTLLITFQAKQPTCFRLDKTIIKEKILGKRRNNLLSVLKEIPGVKEVKVKIKPFWITSIPRKASRVNISINSNTQ